MKSKFKTKFVEIITNKEKSYIEIIRSTETAKMQENDYKKEAVEWLEIIQSEKPKFQLVDDRNMKFVINVKLQDWINKNLITPAVKASIRKTAFIVTNEIFSQVSIEQTLDDNKERVLQINYFENKKDAKDWLFSK